MRHAAIALTTLVCTALPLGAAQAHDIQGYVSSKGLEFLATEMPKYVPSHLSPPDFSKDLACVTAVQRNTEVDLHVDSFQLSIPRAGRIHVDATISADGSGELFAQDVVACLGDLTCQDQFSVHNARAIIDLDVELMDGMPHVTLAAIDVQLDPSDVALSLSGCFASDLANWVIDFAKGWVVDILVGKIEQAAQDAIAPQLETMLGGVLGYSGVIDTAAFDARLEDLLIESGGVQMGADLDISTKYPAAECIAQFDPGEPSDVSGQVPDLTAGPSSQLAIAANVGVINDVLYHVWRRGFGCLTGDHLAALGIDLPLDMAAEMLPGFPPGTEMGVEIFMKHPLEVASVQSGSAEMTLKIRDLDVTIVGKLPDGSEKRMTVSVSAEATAAIGMDPASNALMGQLVSMHMDKLELDQVTASQYGFDVNRLKNVIEDVVVPGFVNQLGAMPLTGPVFAAPGYAIILRDMSTTDAYVGLKADLFAIPTDDFSPPDTALTAFPTSVVSVKNSVIQVSGSDARVPFELLQYRLRVNGVERPLSFMRKFTVGEPGKSGEYQVEVSAADLSGNIDPTPATVTITVDGVAPQLTLYGERLRTTSDPIDLQWILGDDLTPAESIAPRIEIYEVTDPKDLLAVEHIDTRQLPPGTAQYTVGDLPADHLYRIEIHAEDQAGNESSASVVVDLRTGGCSVGGSGAGTGFAAGFALALVALSRRRRRR